MGAYQTGGLGYPPQAFNHQGFQQAYPTQQGFQLSYGPAYSAPGGPAANSAQILGANANIHDFDDNNKNAQNPHYKALRSKAQSEGDKMAHCFEQSQQVYARGDGAGAKKLSQEGHQHKAAMERLNTEARQWIFAANNADSPPDTLDLHGLYVKEALIKVEEAIQKAQAQNYTELKLIVGKGLHSKDHVAHIKPAVERLLSRCVGNPSSKPRLALLTAYSNRYHLDAHVDKHNAGIVVVNLAGPKGGGSLDFTRDIARHATGNDQECVVM